jgi:hypothetical protein
MVNFVRQAARYGPAVDAELLTLVAAPGAAPASFYRGVLTILLDQLAAHAGAASSYKGRPVLQGLFRLNNLCFVHRAIRQPEWAEVLELLGDDFAKRLQQQWRTLVAEHCGLAWDNPMALLPPAGTTTKKQLKAFLRAFNAAFHRDSTGAVAVAGDPLAVPMEDVRIELHDAVAQRVLPAYAAFWAEHAAFPFTHPEKHLMHTPDAVAAALSAYYVHCETGADGGLSRSSVISLPKKAGSTFCSSSPNA